MWWASLVGGLVSVSGSVVGRVLIALGVGFTSYTGLGIGLDSIKTAAFAALTALPAPVLPILGTLKVDVAFSIIFSALAARLVLNGLTGGAIKKMVLR